MREISATDASKRFADLLDAVEHRRESFTIVRRGRTVATISPARGGTFADLAHALHEHPLDEGFAEAIADGLSAIEPAAIRDPWRG